MFDTNCSAIEIPIGVPALMAFLYDSVAGNDHSADLRLSSQLSDETRNALSALCRIRRFHAGQTVLFSGEEGSFVGTVSSGLLRMQMSQADGRQQIIGLCVEGDMFGQTWDKLLPFAIEAATDATICAFQRDRFERLLQRSPDLERVALLNVCNELDRARGWISILSKRHISARLAGFILIICSRYARFCHFVTINGSDVDVRIPISRCDLAHLLATRPESLSRAFHALASGGLIALLKRDTVRILDFKALATKAGDDEPQMPRYMRKRW